MIRVDETDPVGELEPSFPYRDVRVRRGVEFNEQYDIQSEIGRGKFGTVYRCKEKKTGLSLAAKVVNVSKKEDRRSVEREVDIMRRLQHPRLIQLYDAIDTGKQIYVILELIEGGELFERVIDDDFLLTERSCAVFMRQICEGIEFIHAQKILHLDLKPENILCLTKEGNRIKIIDFGLARDYDPNKKLQVLFGTPEFVAPEVVNFDQIGFGTDMWSIGVICYVLLSGLSPFMGDTDIETMANVTIAKYDFDHEAFTDISEDAKDFIRCLLIKDKEKRATASECREHRWLLKRDNNNPLILEEKKGTLSMPTKLEKKRSNDDQILTSSREINGKEEKLSSREEENLDLTKDNLRLFVERWREHPDSPYIIDTIQNVSKFNTWNDLEEAVSLLAQSPSPRESICSMGSSETEFSNSPSFLNVPSIGLALERRASEGTARNKSRDQASQIVLAEEIIKLSEHLRTIAGGIETGQENDDNNVLARDNNDSNFGAATSIIVDKDKSPGRSKKQLKSNHLKQTTLETNECNEITEKLSSLTRQRKLNGTTFHSNRNLDRYNNSIENHSMNMFASFRRKKAIEDKMFSLNKNDSEDNSLNDDSSSTTSSSIRVQNDQTKSMKSDKNNDIDLTPPWRRNRVKHSFGETSRDVPRISNLRDLHKSLNLDEPANTKDLLLHLLGEWEEIGNKTSTLGRKSVSIDWCGEESVARKTMNSLAEYFQSKQQKSTASNVPDDSPPPIYR
ncbi:PREDICTED: myosin light chain kinase, smooth muscle-like [Polistes canadensis]|uniref:myosin light chain kinase, smooth muscle-like n=1 Tax=Polistes canadensis TaxID=91411 RepID=UPI00071901C7|nr:PREDICTED: myosin light chain kinase, smooth muscle-like [Polistes canadensis]